MHEEAEQRTIEFQRRLGEAGHRVALITDESSMAYLADFWGYLSIEFGRPTMLVLQDGEPPTVLTPLMESEMVAAMTWVADVRTWEDAGERRWERVLGEILGDHVKRIGVERDALPAIVRNWLDRRYPGVMLDDVSGLLGEMRMIKSAAEIEVMRQCGTVAGAMMKAAHESLAVGAPEFESALAVVAAGTRAAAGLLDGSSRDRFVSPMIHNLQVLQSGADTSMVHRRASVKTYERGDPVYFCMCNMAEFRHYRLGFDRMFFVEEVSHEAARVQQAAIDAQRAALDMIWPGVRAEEVAAAADEVYLSRGFSTSYRTGRAIGVAYLEAPELKHGDSTMLRPGMTFAVDGGVSVDGRLGGRIGDSVVVTETGYEFLTSYPRELLVV